MDFSSLFSRPPHSVDLMRPSGSPLSASGRDDGCQHAGIKRKRGTHGGEEEEDDDTAEGNAEKLKRDSRTKKKSQGETQQLRGEARDRQNRSYQEELEEYLRVRVEQPERAGHQDRADEVQKPANGRPARQNPAQTGRGKKKKKKKKKKAAANSQPQQGGHRHGNWNKKPPHLVKKPLMTPEFISQHAVEHKGQLICRYFLSGRCIKEDQCKFEHELVALEKKQEICKFYLQGYCTKGENCTYMHNEYPCKFFHTGTKCYQGDHCKFSHEPLTETTRPLLEKVLNKNEADVEKCDLQRGEDGTSSVRVPAVPLSGSLDRRPSFYNSSCPLDLGVHASWVSGAALDVQPVSSALPSSGFSRPQTDPAVAAGDGQFLRPDCSQPEASFPQGAHAPAEIPEGQDLRDSPVLIPLQTLPGTMPRDPRQPCGAHLPVALPRPAFALCMEWLVEDCSSPGLQSFITGVHRTPNPGPTALLVPSQDDPQEEVEGLPGGAPPSQDKPPQAAGQAPAVHSLPIQVVSPWSRATPTGPQQTKHADSTQSGDHSLFLNIFKAPLPLLSASNTSV